MNCTETILIVEDEVISAMMMMLELKKIGFSSLHHVTSGENAIAYARQYIPDVIIMDVRLSGILNGIETAAIIMEVIKPMIIFLTGYNDSHMRYNAEQLKTEAYMMKPVNFDQLKKIILSGTVHG